MDRGMDVLKDVWMYDGEMDRRIGWLDEENNFKREKKKKEGKMKFCFGNGKHWKQLDGCLYNFLKIYMEYI